MCGGNDTGCDLPACTGGCDKCKDTEHEDSEGEGNETINPVTNTQTMEESNMSKKSNPTVEAVAGKPAKAATVPAVTPEVVETPAEQPQRKSRLPYILGGLLLAGLAIAGVKVYRGRKVAGAVLSDTVPVDSLPAADPQ